MHALIVDDQSSNIDVLGRLLVQSGFSYTAVLHANQLAGTIGQLEEVRVIFLDMEIPNGNYLDLLAELKETFPSVPVIAYTVHISEMEQARQAGFDGFLGKPLSTSKFPDQLQRILNGEAVWEY